MTGTVTMVTLGVANTAFANPSTASATCKNGIIYSAAQYPTAVKNTVDVKIDPVFANGVWAGPSVAGYPKTFGASIDNSANPIPFPNKWEAHTWRVIWDRFGGSDGDRTHSGSVEACEAPPTTTTTTTTTTVVDTVPVDTTPGSVVEEATTTTALVSTGEPLPLPETTTTVAAVALTDANRALPVTGTSIMSICVILGLFLLISGGTLSVLKRRRLSDAK